MKGELKSNFAAPVLPMIFPDAETIEFWKKTADYPSEVAERIAWFSRQMRDHVPR